MFEVGRIYVLTFNHGAGEEGKPNCRCVAVDEDSPLVTFRQFDEAPFIVNTAAFAFVCAQIQ